ncbi:WhiB family transcriptional regulator [Streptomyces sp. BH-SS-21]|uniref:WhiB family transcriptional regulator n=1 Tax=Streptomyces liliiviolaceus TaxID=2823109 RepID=A0A940Y531_9ACTN|nr:WhiB family transcriptional regulator [Streptomyces liliiviolaceus]
MAAACATAAEVAADPDLFFPAGKDGERIGIAKRICSTCPVQGACLESALESGDAHGIRGGTTEEERGAGGARFQLRCNPARVEAALSGRDVFLNRVERKELVRIAILTAAPLHRVSAALKVSEPHVKKLLRRERRNRVDGSPGLGTSSRDERMKDST